MINIKLAAMKMKNEEFDKTSQYSIADESQIQEVTQNQTHYMLEVGFPFFEEASSIIGIDKYYNEDLYTIESDKLTKVEQGLLIRRDERMLVNGLIAGMLACPKDFRYLISIYKSLFYHDYQQELLDWVIPKLLKDKRLA